MKILVTAAAAGIGAVTAREARAAGHEVIIADIDIARGHDLAAEIGATFIPADLGVEGDIMTLISSSGAVDLLINNGGIAGPTAPVDQVTTAEWERVLAINVTAQFIACREMIPLMRSAGGGSIVNVSSVAAKIGYPNRSPYAASKWAVLGLTASLAREVGAEGIRVNAILPGAVRGERMDAVISHYAGANRITEQQAWRHYLSHPATERLVEPQEVARMMLYLGSDSARSITGQFISVDGGYQ